MIKAIIFDWKGVLIDNPSKDIRRFCAEYLGTDKSEFSDVYHHYGFLFQKNILSEKEIWENVCSDLKVDKKVKGSLWKKAVVSTFREKKEIFLIARLLRNKGYKLGFLSNTEIPAKEYFFKKRYDELFDAIVFSCDEKVSKPDSMLYNLIIQKLRVKPNETVFIDRKPHFVDAAKRFGMKGIVFKDANQLITDLEKLKIKLI